ncbi:hypothetical protein M422DRAFT_22667 [Sphaerobolus stellatus SS14]|nr:hypothetical protein M422DRAFT_22667 [Sphaerobolus stellatus SS14]
MKWDVLFGPPEPLPAFKNDTLPLAFNRFKLMGNTPSQVPSDDEIRNRRLSKSSQSARRIALNGDYNQVTLQPPDEPPPYSSLPSDRMRLPIPAGDIPAGLYHDPNAIQPSHRRTVSHRSSSQRRYGSSSESPGGGVGGFLVPGDPQYGYPGGNESTMQTTPRRTRSVSPAAVSGSSTNVSDRSTSSGTTHRRINLEEDQFELLRKFDTVIIVDDSTSMRGRLWSQARDAIAGIAAAAAQYDADGIDIYFLNSVEFGRNLKTSNEVQAIFNRIEPRGLTLTGEKLEERLLHYFEKLDDHKKDPVNNKKPKWVNFVVVTDGAPTDDPESVIVVAARRLDEGHYPLSQVGIQFVQIGNSPKATKALQELDDALANKHKIRDMVDTTPYDGKALTTESLGKILLGGINRKVDKEGFKREV